MKLTFARVASAAGLAVVAPLLTVSAFAQEAPTEAQEPQVEATETAVPAQAQGEEENNMPEPANEAVAKPEGEAASTSTAAAPEPETEKLTCRRVQIATGSRSGRSSRLCLTRAEWREYDRGF